MTVKENIESKMNKAIKTQFLEVIDESHKHAGHSGARPEGETHFHINMTADEFNGKSRVARQRLVYKILEDELAGPVHALSLSIKGTDD
ncbi:MAG: BolA family transcriptional regulator [Kordiimonadaceae bacterium]|jgi:BolA family transcriptional regulator, general stress-responsive regulator|nr:BolA family transcriptional regulator [Kordiimonadaceae bacterium]MBT6036829.1 BolA family transcriptional regulator [Kordiimonadaceae bacterium]MBT6328340.1 BolA family transcriptional regulator [Kordiimonadaceae bacterium]MBT7581464.1 BolA family transcriptional regulator [Kordiimonadaceae bacterium]